MTIKKLVPTCAKLPIVVIFPSMHLDGINTWSEYRMYTFIFLSAAWQIYEQVCVAACDCGRLDVAKVSYARCEYKFLGYSVLL